MVKCHSHIGCDHVFVTSGYKCVDFRKFCLIRQSKIRPRKKDIVLRFVEFSDMRRVVNAVNNAYPGDKCPLLYM